MSEWMTVLAVFWALWALDGARLRPRSGFTVVGGCGRWRRAFQGKISLPGFWPGSWRVQLDDVPVAISPVGVSNRPAGSIGRPDERPARIVAWRWAEIREVGVARGWIFINGARFCPDTGHVTAPELIALARLAPAERDPRIAGVIARWFRPEHLRRRLRVLVARTAVPVQFNAIVFLGMVGITVYVVGDLASRLPERASTLLAEWLPWMMLGLFAAHVAAVVFAWRAVRRLKPVTAQKRTSTLLSALLLPPQALRLRALAGEGFFPVQHGAAGMVAAGSGRAVCAAAFNALADLRWPARVEDEPAVAREIDAWFRGALEARLTALLAAAGISTEALLAPPEPDSPASCRYCPRCRDQFNDERGQCPNGVPLCPLARVRR
ncbi:hypothetical protein [Horticoccus sp. 23ND18S-11]|uniref:hypothetical protein n=1 Tax=Horticoccus sp. 23ND18S-11 TaxID=3391832 RepID=UPI0039C9DA04